MFQNLLCFMYKKTHVLSFLFFISSIFEFYFMNALVYVDIDQGIHKKKLKNSRNEKQKKNYMGFLIKHFSKAISWTQTYFFLKSDLYSLTKDLTY